MSMNILNDISKVYLEQVVESTLSEALGTPKRWWDDNSNGIGYEKGEVSGKFKKKKRIKVSEALGTPKRWWDDNSNGIGYEKGEVSGKFKKKKRIKVSEALGTPKRWWDDNSNGIGYEKGEVSGKFKKKKKTRVKKESFSDWRDDLSELMEVIDTKKIQEKPIKNKVVINPKLGEAIEELGGTLLEMVEVDEIDFIIESAYVELLDEGYEEDEIEYALECALTEAKVTFGHDTSSTPEKKKEGLLSLARKKLSGVKKAALSAVARGARGVAKGALGVARKIEGGDKTPSVAQTKVRKASTYRGAGAGTKERLSSGSYTPPTQKKTKPTQGVRVSDPWRGSATVPKPKKAATVATQSKPTTKKSNKLDDLLSNIRNESKIELDEKLNMKKAKMGTVIKDFYKSDAPQFKGMTKEKRRKMAVAAKLTAERGGLKLGEQIVGEDLQPETPQQIAAQNAVLMAQKRLSAANQSSLKKKNKPTQPLETSDPTEK